MNGVCHELWVPDGCNIMPSKIGLPIDNDIPGVTLKIKRIAWYRIECGEGIYLWTRDDVE